MPNGVIIAYEIWYRPTSSPDSETRVNTTGQETSFTTENDLEEGTEFIFSVRAYTRAGPGNTTSITVSTLSDKGIGNIHYIHTPTTNSIYLVAIVFKNNSL